MNKISVTLDVSKISKDKITEREYENKNGEKVKVKEYKVDIVPLKEKKFIKEGQNWTMFKTHFVVEAQTKEEREAKKEQVFVGDGFVFEKDEIPPQAQPQQGDDIKYAPGDINPDDIPF